MKQPRKILRTAFTNEILTHRQDLHGQDFTVAQISCEALSFRDQTFDAVYITHVIEHMSTYIHAMATIKETNRVLKKKGYLILVCPDFNFDQTLFFDGDYSHSFITTRNRVGSLLIDCGFGVLISESIINGDMGLLGPPLKYINLAYNKILYPFVCYFYFKARSRAERLRIAFNPSLFFIAQKSNES